MFTHMHYTAYRHYNAHTLQLEKLKLLWFNALNSSPSSSLRLWSPQWLSLCPYSHGGQSRWSSLSLSLTPTTTTEEKNTDAYFPLFVAMEVPSKGTTMGWLLPCKWYPWETLRLIGRPAAAHLVPSVLCHLNAVKHTVNAPHPTGRRGQSNLASGHYWGLSVPTVQNVIEPSSSESDTVQPPAEKLPLGSVRFQLSHTLSRKWLGRWVTNDSDCTQIFDCWKATTAPSSQSNTVYELCISCDTV